MISSSAELTSKNANRKVRKLLGRAYLRENRISEALEVYLGILTDYPNDADVLMILGNLYRLSGSPAAAEHLYRRILEMNPEDRLTEKQILALQAQPAQEWEAEDPLSAGAIESLAIRLQAETVPEQVEEIRSCADTVEERQGDGNGNGQHGPLPEDVYQLMPALIAQNIRQARAAGFTELAETLQSLQINLARQLEDHWADDLLKDEPSVDKSLDE